MNIRANMSRYKKGFKDGAEFMADTIITKLLDKFKEERNYEAWQIIYDFKKHFNENKHLIK
jgi:hypothetical protein